MTLENMIDASTADDMLDAIDESGYDISLESTLSMLQESMEYVDEGYVGKTANLKKVEHEFALLKEEYGATDNSTWLVRMNKASFNDLNNSTHIKKIEELITKEFGFMKTSIIVMNRYIANAYTMPRSCMINAIMGMPTSCVEHGKKYYDKNHSYFCYICIYAEMFAVLTPGELTACVLHEVGHNFDHTISNYIFDGILWFFNNFFHIIDEYVYFAKDWITALLDRTMIIPWIINIGNALNRGVAMLLGPLGKLSILGNYIAGAMSNPSMAVFGGLRFESEAFADSFATAYGYGAETISMMDKFDKLNLLTKDGLFPELWTGLGDGPLSFVLFFIDPHPENQTRAKMALDNMRQVMNDPHLPRSMRKAVKTEYTRCNNAYKAFLEADKDKSNAVITRACREMKERIFNGKMDFRAFLLAATNPQLATKGRY